jgi:hypothetical protein
MNEWHETPAMTMAANEVATVEVWVRLPYSTRFIRCHCGAVEKCDCRCVAHVPAPGERVH